MRNLFWLERYRDALAEARWTGTAYVEGCGIYMIPSPDDGGTLRCLVSTGYGWEHVSVSREDRCPTWAEMAHIKEKFWRDDEVVMQLHVPRADHVNHHPNCLHLWKPESGDVPRPPKWMVG